MYKQLFQSKWFVVCDMIVLLDMKIFLMTNVQE